MSWPFGCTAAWIASRQAAIASSLSVKQLLHEILQGGDERAERHVLLQQIELARDEIAALPRDRLIDFLHERRLADAGLAGDHDGLDAAARDALEAREQAARLGRAPVELLRRIEAVDDVGAAEREGLERPALLERGEAAAQIRCEPGRALVAILGLLLQQLQHDVGQRLRHARVAASHGGTGLPAM